VLDLGDSSDICKYLMKNKLQFGYLPCKVTLLISTIGMDGLSGNIPQLCFDIEKPTTGAVINSIVGALIGGVFISGSVGESPAELWAVYGHVSSVATGTTISNYLPYFAKVFQHAKM